MGRHRPRAALLAVAMLMVGTRSAHALSIDWTTDNNSKGHVLFGDTPVASSLTLKATSGTPASGAHINFQSTSDYWDAFGEGFVLHGTTPLLMSATGQQNFSKTGGAFQIGTLDANALNLVTNGTAGITVGSTQVVRLTSLSGAGTQCVQADNSGALSGTGTACGAGGAGGGGGITQIIGDITAGPGSGSQAATIAANAVDNTKFRQSAANSLVGNPAGSAANVTDVGIDSTLRLNAGQLGLATLPGLYLLGTASTSTGPPAGIGPGSALQVPQINSGGTAIAWSMLTPASISGAYASTNGPGSTSLGTPGIATTFARSDQTPAAYRSDLPLSTTWFVDPVNGSDVSSNSGTSSATAIKTMQELARRWWGAEIQSNTTVTILGNIPSTDLAAWNFTVRSAITVTFVGSLGPTTGFGGASIDNTLVSGTVTSFTAASATPAADDIEMTDSAIPVSWTSSGVLANGVILRINGGTRNGWTFYALKDLGSKTLRITVPTILLVQPMNTALVVGDAYAAYGMWQMPNQFFGAAVQGIVVDSLFLNGTRGNRAGFIGGANSARTWYGMPGVFFNVNTGTILNPMFAPSSSLSIQQNTGASLGAVGGGGRGTGALTMTFAGGTFMDWQGSPCFEGMIINSNDSAMFAIESAIAFHDTTGPMLSTAGNGLIAIDTAAVGVGVSGKGNTSKIVSAVQSNGAVSWGLNSANPPFVAAVTTDANPIAIGSLTYTVSQLPTVTNSVLSPSTVFPSTVFETGGPSRLTFGAIANGSHLQLSGTTIIGDTATYLTAPVALASVTAPTGSGFSHVTLGAWDSAARAVDVSGADITNQLKAASFPALTGPVTTPGGSLATTLNLGAGGVSGQLPCGSNSTWTGDVTNSGCTTAFRPFAATSVLGRSAGTTGVPTEVSSSANNQVLQQLAGALSFHALDYSQLTGTPSSLPPSGAAGGDLTGTYPNPTIGTNKTTYAKMQQVSAVSLLGNATGGAANVEEITLGSHCAFTGTVLDCTTGAGTITLTGDATGSGTSTIAVTNVNLPNGVTMAGELNITETAAPATPASGHVDFFADSTQHNGAFKNSSGTVTYGAQVDAGTSHHFLTSFAATGAFGDAQPVEADVVNLVTDLAGKQATLSWPAAFDVVISPGGTGSAAPAFDSNFTYNNSTHTLTSAGTTVLGTFTGLLKGTSGTVGTATSGVDFQAPLSWPAAGRVTISPGGTGSAAPASDANFTYDNTTHTFTSAGTNVLGSATGIAKLTAGTVGTATSGIDYQAPIGWPTAGAIVASPGGTGSANPIAVTVDPSISYNTGTQTLALPNTGVTANTYGGAGGYIKAIQVDAKGRLVANPVVATGAQAVAWKFFAFGQFLDANIASVIAMSDGNAVHMNAISGLHGDLGVLADNAGTASAAPYYVNELTPDANGQLQVFLGYASGGGSGSGQLQVALYKVTGDPANFANYTGIANCQISPTQGVGNNTGSCSSSVSTSFAPGDLFVLDVYRNDVHGSFTLSNISISATLWIPQ